MYIFSLYKIPMYYIAQYLFTNIKIIILILINDIQIIISLKKIIN